MLVDQCPPEAYRLVRWRSLWRRLLTHAAAELGSSRATPNLTFEQGKAADVPSAALEGGE